MSKSPRASFAPETTGTLEPPDRRTVLYWCGALPLAALTSACSEGRTAPGWDFSPENPILGGTLGVCFDPFVIKVGRLYRMWFSWRPKKAIAYTESTDGLTWSDPVIVLTADPDADGQIEVNRPAVLIREGRHHMWFTGQTRNTSQIFYATSGDGLNWDRVTTGPVLVPGAPWEGVATMCPDVLWDAQAEQYRMYYSAGEQYEPNAIGVATSPDGTQWTRRETPVFTANRANPWERARVTASDVHHIGDWYYLFYIGFADIHRANIGVARSQDGLTAWQRHPQNPILKAPGMTSPFAWDRDAIYRPSAVLDTKGWTLFFNARRNHIEQIGVARHAGRDLGF